jgi:hypothetical protein
MMRTPNVYSADEIKNWDVQSWMVFTGKADVLVWLSEND